MFSTDGSYEMEAEGRIAAGNRINGYISLGCIDETTNLSTATRLAVHNAVRTNAVIRQPNLCIKEKE